LPEIAAEYASAFGGRVAIPPYDVVSASSRP
jgi:hypothetical protein